MANELTTVNSSTAVAVSGNPFLDAADDMGASSGLLYTKFDGNTGVFSFGKDGDELNLGTRVAINPSEFKAGWICWKDGSVMEEIMVRITEGKPPAKGALTDYGPYDDEQDGWSEQSSMQFRDIETGDEFQYKTSSKSGRIAIANLIRDYGKAFQRHPGQLAIVELGNTSFEATNKKTGKKLGKKFAPVFKIVDWQDEEALIAKFAAQADADGDNDVGGEDDDLPVNTGAVKKRKF